MRVQTDTAPGISPGQSQLLQLQHLWVWPNHNCGECIFSLSLIIFLAPDNRGPFPFPFHLIHVSTAWRTGVGNEEQKCFVTCQGPIASREPRSPVQKPSLSKMPQPVLGVRRSQRVTAGGAAQEEPKWPAPQSQCRRTGRKKQRVGPYLRACRQLPTFQGSIRGLLWGLCSETSVLMLTVERSGGASCGWVDRKARRGQPSELLGGPDRVLPEGTTSSLQ